jgi:hypothetical protein
MMVTLVLTYRTIRQSGSSNASVGHTQRVLHRTETAEKRMAGNRAGHSSRRIRVVRLTPFRSGDSRAGETVKTLRR